MNAKILIIDDNPDVLKSLSVLFTVNDLDSATATSPAEALVLLAEEEFDLVIQDMNYVSDTTSGEEGIALFHRIRESYPVMPVILLTGWTDLSTAVDLVKAGAADYLGKPWDDQKLLLSVNNLIRLHQLQRSQDTFSQKQSKKRLELEQKYDLCGTCFDSAEMLQVLEMATQVAHADVPILITGPNGAGKEKIAEVVQANSSCRTAAFVKVNVGALPDNLIEAELFGAEAGAFTGATKQRIGRFEAADGGTLFLDEIGNLSMEGQRKLLRVLQTGEFERLGSTETQKVTVRLISATNVDLAQAIIDGTFREDLYYRLNVIELKLPPLEERKEDILPLARLFLDQDYSLAPCAKRKLKQYHWPGNVRQLENTLKRAMLLCQGVKIKAVNLGIEIDRSRQLGPREPTIAQIEQALATADGVIAVAAKALGLSRQSLYRRMDKLDLS
ncbi:MAG: DNA-binding NtrC family response regulator [Phenylobacterium sp.]|jgi:DNA-binding NtrC family response regulator